MVAHEPRLRRRGFFLHSDTTGESDTGELESPEGFVARVRLPRSSAVRLAAPTHGIGEASAGGRGRHATAAAPATAASREEDEMTASPTEDGEASVRSGSVTGSRQRAHTRR